VLKRLSAAGHVKTMAEDEWAHIVLIAALTFTDDTALLKKSIVPELLVRLLLSVGRPGDTPLEFTSFQKTIPLSCAHLITGECLFCTVIECQAVAVFIYMVG